MVKIFLVLACLSIPLIFSSELQAQKLQVKENLQPHWKVYEEDFFRPYVSSDAGEKSIYLEIDAHLTRHKYLQVKSKQHPVIFIDGMLLLRCKQHVTQLSLDSIQTFSKNRKYRIGIYQSSINPEALETFILERRIGPAESSYHDLPPSYLRDFVIVAFLLLLIILIVFMKMNYKLTLDYFSFIKLFSGQESDEIQSRSGIGMSLLFYGYCCMILSFYLLIIFQFTAGEFSLAWNFQIKSFGHGFWQWLKLWGILLLTFFMKISIIYIMARTFNMRDTFSFHVFNWTRLMLVATITFLVIAVTYFISRGYSEGFYSTAYFVVPWILVFWTVLLFPKVARRSSFSLFHLFSYLCATEIIPLLISIRVLFN